MANPHEQALPPGGTRGSDIPPFVRPVLHAMSWTSDLMFRFGVKIQGRPLVKLRTKGARSGKQRTVILGSFPEDDGSVVVVASNGGGRRHPGWAHNLTAHPTEATVDYGDGEIAVDARLLVGEERAAMWEQVVELAPGYGRYTTKTDREIPLFRLSPRG